MALDTDKISTEELQRKIQAAKRLLAINEAKQHLIKFIRFTMPDPEDPEDTDKSAYRITPQAKLLCDIMEKVFLGAEKRVAIAIPPQHGKTQVVSKHAPAWFAGKNPRVNILAGSYNQDYANTIGDDVLGIMRSQPYKQVFPGLLLINEAKNLIKTHRNGKLSFVGVGGSGTGKTADVFVIDDPYRNEDDANSDVYRERVWGWFNKVVMSRARNVTRIVILHTRWHEDDLIGRLCDPDHPERKKKYAGIAEKWTYINIPGVVTDPALADALGLKLEVQTEEDVVKQFGRKPMVALDAAEKNLVSMAENKLYDPLAFSSLYMGRPSPDDGYHFRREDLVEYDLHELPKLEHLEKYGASDHSATENTKNDPSVIGCAGVDPTGHIWILPDVVWDRFETDRTVEEIIAQMKIHQPNLWWMENELISKSFGPFLRKRMFETQTYTTIDPVTPTKDKISRSRAIQGRMRMRMVHFPRTAPWWEAAKAQLLKFPYGANDDFVDWLSWIGLGLLKELNGRPTTANDNARPRTGSIEWILAQTKRNATKSPHGVYKGWRVG